MKTLKTLILISAIFILSNCGKHPGIDEPTPEKPTQPETTYSIQIDNLGVGSTKTITANDVLVNSVDITKGSTVTIKVNVKANAQTKSTATLNRISIRKSSDSSLIYNDLTTQDLTTSSVLVEKQVTADIVGLNKYDVETVYNTDNLIKYSVAFNVVDTSVPTDSIPTISFINPTSDVTLTTSDLNVQVNASDDKGVSKVEYYINGNIVSTQTASPYNFTFTLSNYSNGVYTLKAKVYDTVNQTAETTSINITVDKPYITHVLNTIVSVYNANMYRLKEGVVVYHTEAPEYMIPRMYKGSVSFIDTPEIRDFFTAKITIVIDPAKVALYDMNSLVLDSAYSDSFKVDVNTDYKGLMNPVAEPANQRTFYIFNDGYQYMFPSNASYYPLDKTIYFFSYGYMNNAIRIFYKIKRIDTGLYETFLLTINRT